MSANLKSLSIFVDSRSKVNLPEKSFSSNILMILDDPRGQKSNFKVKYAFNIYATNWSTYNTFLV